MTHVPVCLRFECHECGTGVELKVECSGTGLRAGPQVVAAVTVTCPDCQASNQVCFHPTGVVVAVREGSNEALRRLQPSVN